MLKRIMLFILVLTTLALVVMAPLSASVAAENIYKAQTTVEVTVIVPTFVPEATQAPNQPTSEMPQSTMLMFGLLVIILLIIIIGGVILASRPTG